MYQKPKNGAKPELNISNKNTILLNFVRALRFILLMYKVQVRLKVYIFLCEIYFYFMPNHLRAGSNFENLEFQKHRVYFINALLRR